MTLERYSTWLAHGRAHQSEGRVIDALLCYRLALREAPEGIDARFHLGEIAWHLGNAGDAIAAWEGVVARAAGHRPSLHALTDAYAAIGRFDASAQAVSRVLALSPREPRANTLSVLLRVARGERVEDQALARAVRSDRTWPLALLAAAGVRALGRAQEYASALPLLLDASAAAPVTQATEDALRALTLAAHRAGDATRASAFADRYAQSCRALHRPAMPLLWPLRAAGSSIRVGALVAGDAARDAIARLTAIDRLLMARWSCTVFVVAAADAGVPDSVALTVRGLPADPDAAARGIAALDLDVLLDWAALQAPLGPLLALHPARVVVCVDDDRGPVASGLADRVVRVSADTVDPLVEVLVAMHADVERQPAASMTVGDLAALWDQSVHAHRRGDAGAAAAGYAKFLAVQPDSASARFLRSELARAGGDISQAREDLRAAVRVAPGFVDAVVALANLETAAGNASEAVAVARRGLEHAPAAAALRRALGQAALARADGETAAQAFAEAALRDPTHGETHYNHGVALQMAGRTSDAARAYQRALAFEPELHDADFNLGVIFDQQGNAGAAIAAFSNVLRRAPSHARSYKALAETLLASGRIDAWLANFERFERNCPNHLALAAQALEVCAYRADFPRLERYLDGLRAGRFTDGAQDEMQDALEQLLYLLHFFDVEPPLIGRYARTHDALARRIHGEPRPPRAERRPGRVRIGYLSGDFRNHVMGKMMWHALRHHDAHAFEVFGYTTTDVRDEWTKRYETLFGRLASVAGRGDADAADRVAEDDLDVLVDLSTHTKGGRPGVLARKPARLQITHVASAGTLGLSAIDYKLTDAYADVGFDSDAQIEPPLVMEGCVYPYRHVAPVAEELFTRAQANIPEGAVTIGAFVTPLKLSQRGLALWRDVLQRVPDAVLVFSPVQPSLRAVYQRICASAGIEARRVAFVPQGRDDAENQARYRLIDFVLDPLPYGGVNGTLEALDMEVPVVTLVGRRHAERTSYSILANLGITDTVAITGGEYVDIAVRLATDGAFAADLRARIRAALAHSALTDMPQHARNLEQAYMRALRERAPGVVDQLPEAARAR
jgi:predicted O-linked N-acetylglucosamine transferase (SPINDLY family)